MIRGQVALEYLVVILVLAAALYAMPDGVVAQLLEALTSAFRLFTEGLSRP
ncbi:MAG: hypothetical protein H6934_13115 [Burkholderiaceae bacterium]|nr:hypothetical protein [Burkholderiaceae bacterium]